ncbi:MAG: o-succinylbenzoate--CoA ligase [Planctomycetales bacterium]|nr:o-succinylbenzoate--CoA ligase [Planctomycetales bacterium]
MQVSRGAAVIDRSIACPLYSAAETVPDAPFLIDDDCVFSYSDFSELVDCVVKDLIDRYIDQGDRLAFRAPNNAVSLATIWACFRLRVIACPISTRVPHSTAQQMADQISGILIEPLASAKPNQPSAHNAPVTVSPDDYATIIFSSGSTGTPKAVVHKLQAHFASARASNKRIPLAESDRWLLLLPVYHVGGLAIVFRCVLSRAAVVIPSPKKEVEDSIIANSVTHLSLVATQLKRILAANPESLRRCKAVLVGGGPIPRELALQATLQNVPLHVTYGMSEFASQVATSPRLLPDELANDDGHNVMAGNALSHAQIAIASDGEILVRGESLMEGYWRRDASGSSCDTGVDSEGWYHTNDMGTLDEFGRLSVLGRKDNMFISGGENIHPEEIEAAIMTMSEVRQALVVAVPNGEYGHRPIAFVDSSASFDASRIRDHLMRHLPRFKIPDSFLAWPKQAIGSMKPSRAQFRQLAVDQLQHGQK